MLTITFLCKFCTAVSQVPTDQAGDDRFICHLQREVIPSPKSMVFAPANNVSIDQGISQGPVLPALLGAVETPRAGGRWGGAEGRARGPAGQRTQWTQALLQDEKCQMHREVQTGAVGAEEERLFLVEGKAAHHLAPWQSPSP